MAEGRLASVLLSEPGGEQPARTSAVSSSNAETLLPPLVASPPRPSSSLHTPGPLHLPLSGVLFSR